MPNDASTETERVVVEGQLGAMSGYYHSLENGTHLGPEEMSREEAEELGYSPCSSCFPEVFDDV